jgi:hypothetical protein
MRLSRPLVIAGAAAGLIALAAVAFAVIWTLRSDDPNLLTEAPAIPTATAAGLDESPTQEPGTQTIAELELPEGVRRFVVAAGDSSAKYVVEETLSGLPATAVGTTTDVAGEIYLTADGSTTASSRNSRLTSAR